MMTKDNKALILAMAVGQQHAPSNLSVGGLKGKEEALGQ
jgi:hypothetical protein